MKDKTIELIKKTFNENKNSHAFLMETDNINLCLNDIKKIIFDINNKHFLENIENLPDLMIIEPDGKEIKREQVTEIVDNFKTYPVELKHRYYIVLNSDAMNKSAANTILKFLEEPENSIVGFFITKNKSAMINTIVSRCQHFKLIYNEMNSLDEEKINKFLNGMNYKEFYKRMDFLNLFVSKDRNENILFFKEVQNYILEKSNININIKSLVNQLTLLDNVVERLLKNANQELVYLDLARNWK